jgi:hypothetical protein
LHLRKFVNLSYWSTQAQNCTACPNGFFSGYGQGIGNSQNSITNRCYYIDNTNFFTYSVAINNCNSVNSRLITIRNTFEMALVSSWTANTRSYWARLILKIIYGLFLKSIFIWRLLLLPQVEFFHGAITHRLQY